MTEQKQEDPRRRLKIVYADPCLIVNMLNGFKRSEIVMLPVTDEIPEDVEVESVYWAHERLAFELILRHSSFDEVQDGERIPELALDEFILYKNLRREKALSPIPKEGVTSN